MSTGYVYDGHKYDGLDEVAAILVEEVMDGSPFDSSKVDVFHAVPLKIDPCFTEMVLDDLDGYLDVGEASRQPSEVLPKEIKDELDSVVAKIAAFVEKNYWEEGEKISDKDYKVLSYEVIQAMEATGVEALKDTIATPVRNGIKATGRSHVEDTVTHWLKIETRGEAEQFLSGLTPSQRLSLVWNSSMACGWDGYHLHSRVLENYTSLPWAVNIKKLLLTPLQFTPVAMNSDAGCPIVDISKLESFTLQWPPEVANPRAVDFVYKRYQGLWSSFTASDAVACLLVGGTMHHVSFMCDVF